MPLHPHPLTASFIVHEDFAHIAPAIQSLYSSTALPCTIYVVINAGAVNAINLLKEQFPDVKVIVNSSPKGFAANHNMIMRVVDTPFIALLNDDISIHSGALDIVLAYMQEHPKVGLCGVALQNPDGTPQVSVYSDPRLLFMIYKISGLGNLTTEGTVLRRILQRLQIGKLLGTQSLIENTSSREVPVVKGAVMIVRMSALNEVGLMDETTRMYSEEVDWHWRFRKAGWQVHMVPTAQITHYGIGQQISTSTLIEDRKGILNYFIKHRPHWQSLVIRATIIVAHSINALFYLLLDRKRALAHIRTAVMGATWRRDVLKRDPV